MAFSIWFYPKLAQASSSMDQVCKWATQHGELNRRIWKEKSGNMWNGEGRYWGKYVCGRPRKPPGSQSSWGPVTFPYGNSVLGPQEDPKHSWLLPRCLPAPTWGPGQNRTSPRPHTSVGVRGTYLSASPSASGEPGWGLCWFGAIDSPVCEPEN